MDFPYWTHHYLFTSGPPDLFYSQRHPVQFIILSPHQMYNCEQHHPSSAPKSYLEELAEVAVEKNRRLSKIRTSGLL